MYCITDHFKYEIIKTKRKKKKQNEEQKQINWVSLANAKRIGWQSVQLTCYTPFCLVLFIWKWRTMMSFLHFYRSTPIVNTIKLAQTIFYTLQTKRIRFDIEQNSIFFCFNFKVIWISIRSQSHSRTFPWYFVLHNWWCGVSMCLQFVGHYDGK